MMELGLQVTVGSLHAICKLDITEIIFYFEIDITQEDRFFCGICTIFCQE